MLWTIFLNCSKGCTMIKQHKFKLLNINEISDFQLRDFLLSKYLGYTPEKFWSQTLVVCLSMVSSQNIGNLEKFVLSGFFRGSRQKAWDSCCHSGVSILNIKISAYADGGPRSPSAHAWPFARPTISMSGHFSAACVCRVTFKHLPLTLRTHIQSFRTLRQLLNFLFKI